MREILEALLTREGYDVRLAANAAEGLDLVRSVPFDAAIVDMMMPGMDGISALEELKKIDDELPVLMITAFASVENAITAMKRGAYDYITKPFKNDEVLVVLRNALAQRRLVVENRALRQNLQARSNRFGAIIGRSSPMRQVFDLIIQAAPSRSTILIQGESGTGKELVARAIHYRSPRKDKPFVAVNCSALTDTLLESELFGHVKGSFTGATGNKKGLFEAADGGTIFLDEIGDVPPATQVRLLRVLQEGEVKRVGANDTIKVDVRVIAASNVDLARAKDQGKFREDLFYRLNVITVSLPPLRDRPEDVPLLAGHFLRMYAGKMEKKVTGISPSAMEALVCHRWMGNVRELENVIERAVVLTSREVIDVEDLPQQLRESPGGGGDVEVLSLAHLPYAEAKRLAMRAFERRYLSALLEKSGHNVSSAARAAGVDRSNFRRLLKQYEVVRGPIQQQQEVKPKPEPISA